MTDINLTVSKAQAARIRSQKIGVTNQVTTKTLSRWRARERADEAFALSLNVQLSYDSIRRKR